jgi:hypothetical protein
MAARLLEPVFLVTYTLAFGALFNTIDLLLFVGIAIGYFTGTMLLRRTARVFNKKTFLGAGAMIAAVFVTLLLSWLDPLGIEDWIPEANEVESVTLCDTSYLDYGPGDRITLQHPEEIEEVLRMHKQALENEDTPSYSITDGILTEYRPRPFTIQYHLTNGKTVCRYYRLDRSTKEAQKLNDYFTTAMSLFASKNYDPQEIVDYVRTIQISYNCEPSIYRDLIGREADLLLLLEALASDMEAGNLPPVLETRNDHLCTLYLNGDITYELAISHEYTHTIAWLREYNPAFDTWMEDNFD